ncbi:MAG: tetratricopeptide repeat protein [Candidatus Kapaibacterium sp.]
MPQSNELRLFISSTFRDLQEEREHLVKKVFPEIRALCRERGVTFADVDLRWGITEEEAQRDGIIRICLEEIDRCRPYFIGILGERYGWVPSNADVERVAADFPLFGPNTPPHTSITELEILHGVLENPEMGGHAFFYLRHPDGTPPEFIDTEPEAVRRLAELKNRIRESGFPVRENFRTPAELGEQIKRDLLQVLDIDFPPESAPSPLDVERRKHQAFSRSRIRAFVENPAYVESFLSWSLDSALPLVVHGESGLGKSSLLAHLSQVYRANNPNALVVEHYVGATDSSGSAIAVMQHIVEEIREHFSVDERLPATKDEFERDFSTWLFRLERLAAAADVPVLIVIDAVNQLGAYGQSLEWLPLTIPPGVKLLISTTPGECDARLRERGWKGLEVEPLKDEQLRQAILVRYLGEVRKSVTSEQLRRLGADPKSSSPLFLRVVAEEMRLHGEHETLDQLIGKFIDTGTLLETFDHVLARIEGDFGAPLVRSLLGFIGSSRSGLSENELLTLSGMTRLDLSSLLFALDYHLIHRDGLLGFFHDYLRRAVENRYLSDAATKRKYSRQLATYFAEQDVSNRIAGEVISAYRHLEDVENLSDYLTRVPVLAALLTETMAPEVLATTKRLIDGGLNLVDRCMATTEDFLRGGHDPDETLRGLNAVGNLLEAMGCYDAALDVMRNVEEIGEDVQNRDILASSENLLALLCKRKGDLNGALEHFRAASRICAETGNRKRLARVIGNEGTTLADLSRLDEALKLYEKALTIHEEIGDLSGTAVNLANIAITHSNRGQYRKALELFERCRAIREAIGEVHLLGLTYLNIGIIYHHLRRYDDCLGEYQKAEESFERLGDMRFLALLTVNTGCVYSELSADQRAMEYYTKALKIYHKLGLAMGEADALLKIGNAHYIMKDYAAAQENLERSMNLCAELGDRMKWGECRNNIGQVHAAQRRYEEALRSFFASADTRRELKLPHWLSDTLEAIVLTLLDICASEKRAPDYLREFVPNLDEQGGDPESWKKTTLKFAQGLAEECHELVTGLGEDNLKELGTILRARIMDAEGKPAEALEYLERAIAAVEALPAPDENAQFDSHSERLAQLHYWCWKIDSNATTHRNESLRLYRVVNEAITTIESRERIAEMEA